MNILDFLFPKYCVNCRKMGEFLCADCFSKLSFDVNNICIVCTKPSYNSLTHPACRKKSKIEGVFVGLVYENVAKKLIHQFKYEPYLSSLSPYLAELLYDSLIQKEEFSPLRKLDIILVPIPLSQKKFRERGYNQSELLAKELSRKFGWKTINILNRVKNTNTQVGLTKEQRQDNIHDAFEINSKRKAKSLKIDRKNILLVDDVVTTGSTLNEATKILKKAGAGRVWGLAFAKED